MQRRFLPVVLTSIALIGLLFTVPGASHARQGAPPMAGMAEVAKKKQSEAMKSNFGFTDAQVKRYFAKESKLNTQAQTELATLRKKLVATKDREMRRRVVGQMRDLNTSLNTKYKDAMLSVATPAQRPKIASSL